MEQLTHFALIVPRAPDGRGDEPDAQEGPGPAPQARIFKIGKSLELKGIPNLETSLPAKLLDEGA